MLFALGIIQFQIHCFIGISLKQADFLWSFRSPLQTDGMRRLGSCHIRICGLAKLRESSPPKGLRASNLDLPKPRKNDSAADWLRSWDFGGHAMETAWFVGGTWLFFGWFLGYRDHLMSGIVTASCYCSKYNMQIWHGGFQRPTPGYRDGGMRSFERGDFSRNPDSFALEREGREFQPLAR